MRETTMTPINNVGAAGSINKLQTTAAPARSEPAADASRARDSVELSGVQGYLAALKTNDIRADKVAEIKAQIDAGTYETDEKLDIAADRLLDDVL
jgi:negative regulator of flagellin synthesis FlgM